MDSVGDARHGGSKGSATQRQRLALSRGLSLVNQADGGHRCPEGSPSARKKPGLDLDARTVEAG